MLYIAICDDEPAFTKDLRDKILEVLDHRGMLRYRIDEYAEPGSLLRKVGEGMAYNILFLDIMLGDENGIEAAKELRGLHGSNSSIIFVSSRPQFAIETFPVGPENFLTKPVQGGELRVALGVSLKKWEEDATIRLTDTQMNIHIVRLGDIIYFENYYREVVVHIENREAIVCNGQASDYTERLPEPRFYSCHRSFIVNLGKVSWVGREQLEMKNGVSIPIPRRRYEDTLKVWGKQMEVTP